MLPYTDVQELLRPRETWEPAGAELSATTVCSGQAWESIFPSGQDRVLQRCWGISVGLEAY